MPTFEHRSTIDASAKRIFAWHARPGAFQRLTPPWAPVELERWEGIAEGDRAVLRVGPGPFKLRWVAEHHDVIEGEQFCDRQVQGPFARWDHTHRFESVEGEDDQCRLVDRIEYELPGGSLVDWAGPWLEGELRRQFAYRHRVTRRDLELHRRYNPEGRSLTVAVSGASGLVGSQMAAFLSAGGHRVKRLTRSGPTGEGEILWDPRSGRVETEKLEGGDAVIHLAGENVFGLWTPSKKQRIYSSRADGTRLLAEALASLDDPPDVLLSSSAVGYYGDHGTDVITEESTPRGDFFLTEVCEAWENATEPAASAGIRTVQMRTGVILSPAGGALRLMLPAFWFGLGGRVGARNQYFPWITLDDAIGGFYHALWTDDLSGPVNLSSPTPVTMQRYTKTLADVLHRPAFLTVPTSVVRGVMGQMADEMVLASARVVPERLQESGYEFGYGRLTDALRHVLGRTE